ncbi:MAG: hypothetical protein AAF721_02435 [Myxococcota bacterium]
MAADPNTTWGALMQPLTVPGQRAEFTVDEAMRFDDTLDTHDARGLLDQLVAAGLLEASE